MTVGGAGCDEMPLPTTTLEQALEAGRSNTNGFETDRYATGVLTSNSSGLYWRLVDSETGMVLDLTSVKTSRSSGARESPLL